MSEPVIQEFCQQSTTAAGREALFAATHGGLCAILRRRVPGPTPEEIERLAREAFEDALLGLNEGAILPDAFAAHLRRCVLKLAPQPPQPSTCAPNQHSVEIGLQQWTGLDSLQQRALKAYYVDGLAEQSVCLRYGINPSTFHELKTRLRKGFVQQISRRP